MMSCCSSPRVLSLARLPVNYDGDEADDARSVATTSSRRSGYMRLLTLSDGLAALFGEAQMQRSEVCC